MLGIWESIEKIASVKRRTPTKKILQWLIVGYLSFMAPMGTIYILFPSTRNGVASIMCGFALLLAFILAFKIVPAYDRRTREAKKRFTDAFISADPLTFLHSKILSGLLRARRE